MALRGSKYFVNRKFEEWLRYEDVKGEGYNFQVIQLLSPQKGEFILDDGCGNGRFSLAMADKGGKVVSLDVNKFMVQTTKRRAVEKGLKKRIDVVIGDCQNLPFRDRLFDKVLCIHNMWYVPVYEKAVNEVFRTTKMGGKIVVDQISEKWHTRHSGFIRRFLEGIRRFMRYTHLSAREMPEFLRTPEQFLRPFANYHTRFYSIPLPLLLYEILDIMPLPNVFKRVKSEL